MDREVWRDCEARKTVSAGRRPRVSIGLPVYNGMPYLPQAVASILAQTFDDLELVISDNASDDGSQDYCQRLARSDPRVRFVSSPTNQGAAPNYNRVFALSRGDYFKWAAADDVCETTFIEKCVDVFQRDPDVVVSYPQTRYIDGAGHDVERGNDRLELDHDSPVRRFTAAVFRVRTATSVFGLIRRSALVKTRLIGAYPSSDLVLLAELAAVGKFHEVPEVLFVKREHAGNSMHAYRKMSDRAAWFATEGGVGHLYPRWRLIREFARAAQRHFPTVTDRAICYVCLGDLVRRMWPRMIREAAVPPILAKRAVRAG